MELWNTLKNFVAFVIAIVLVLLINELDDHIQETEDRAVIAIAGHCRVLIALDEPLTPNGPCYDKEVKAIWSPIVEANED